MFLADDECGHTMVAYADSYMASIGCSGEQRLRVFQRRINALTTDALTTDALGFVPKREQETKKPFGNPRRFPQPMARCILNVPRRFLRADAAEVLADAFCAAMFPGPRQTFGLREPFFYAEQGADINAMKLVVWAASPDHLRAAIRKTKCPPPPRRREAEYVAATQSGWHLCSGQDDRYALVVMTPEQQARMAAAHTRGCQVNHAFRTVGWGLAADPNKVALRAPSASVPGQELEFVDVERIACASASFEAGDIVGDLTHDGVCRPDSAAPEPPTAECFGVVRVFNPITATLMVVEPNVLSPLSAPVIAMEERVRRVAWTETRDVPNVKLSTVVHLPSGVISLAVVATAPIRAGDKLHMADAGVL